MNNNLKRCIELLDNLKFINSNGIIVVEDVLNKKNVSENVESYLEAYDNYYKSDLYNLYDVIELIDTIAYEDNELFVSIEERIKERVGLPDNRSLTSVMTDVLASEEYELLYSYFREVKELSSLAENANNDKISVETNKMFNHIDESDKLDLKFFNVLLMSLKESI